MPDNATLTLRQLNRATLARQLLLERASLAVPAAVEQLAGMQAQLPGAPYVGLWTRLQNFERDDLARHIEDRAVVKATMMRATLHLVTAADYARFRATLQPLLTAAFESIAKKRSEIDFERVIAAAKPFMEAEPRSFAELSAMLTERFPGHDVGAMRYAVRTHLPMIQVPTETRWSFPGNPKFTPAESWLGQPIPTDEDLPALMKRYLAAFGPARVTDLQTWSGLGKLRSAVDALRSELVTYRDEQGVELFDVPDAPLPDADTPAPERFLPEFDNLLLSHSNRARVVADDYRSKVYLPGLRVAATVLVDGFVRGVWKVEKTKSAATFTIEPLAALTRTNRANLSDEAERLIRFIEPGAKAYEVRFTD